MDRVKFDLSLKRPQILLFGNGLVYNKNWNEVIRDLKEAKKENFEKNSEVPYPLQSSALLNSEDKIRQEKYYNYFNKCNNDKPYYEYKEKYPALEIFGDIDFDAYLTTNYTYELESVFDAGYLSLKEKVKRAQTTQKEKDKKRIKYTYNSFLYKGKQKNIWHIHGEVRNKSSLIFTHNDYCRLIGDLKEINDKAGNKYEKTKNKFFPNSWFDYFIVADIYILGLGMSFSEIDLWWLLCRRLREKSGYGKIYFFEPTKNQYDKYRVMKYFDINIDHLGFNDENGNLSNEEYEKFYIEAFNKINKIMEENSK